MKVLLPDTIADVTLKQFQELYTLTEVEGLTEKELEKEKLRIFIGLDEDQIKGISQNDYDSLILSIDEALNKPSEFQAKFKMNGVDFGFIPNFDDITSFELEHLLDYGTEPDNLHYIMAILFRPLLSKDILGNYKIASYKADEKWAEIMKDTPLNIVNGALIFFSSLSNESRIYIQRFSEQKGAAKDRKLQSFLLSGGGMPAL